MLDGSLLGVVDIACEHGIALPLQLALPGQIEQEALASLIDEVLRKIRKHMRRRLAERLETARVGSEQLTQVEPAAGGVEIALQGNPCPGPVAAGWELIHGAIIRSPCPARGLTRHETRTIETP
jgi:hypothetical protein